MDYSEILKSIISDKIKDLGQNTLLQEKKNNAIKLDESLFLVDMDFERSNDAGLSSFKNLSIDDILSVIEVDDEKINQLKFYSLIGNLKESSIKKLREIINELRVKLKEFSNGIDSNLDGNLDYYKELLGKIGTYSFDVNDIDKIFSLLEENNSEYTLGIIKDISFGILRNRERKLLDREEIEEDIVDEIIEEDEVEELVETNISSDELVNLFSRYNLNYMDFNKNSRDELELYGNLNNIENIIQFLLKNNIYLSNYLKSSKKLARILIYSNSEIINGVFEKLKEYGLNINEIFPSIIDNPSKFIKRKRKYVSRHSDGVTGGGSSDEEIGSNEDFIQNLDFFNSLGVDIKKVFLKNPSIFERPHEAIKFTKNIFDLYGIDKTSYLKVLSSFRLKNPADTIDMFIELNQFDYVINNPSKFSLAPDTHIFYKLYYAKKLGKTNNELFNGRGFKYTFENFEGINNENGSEVVGQYFSDNPLFEEYEKIVSKSDNNKCYNITGQDIINEFDKEFSSRDDQKVYIIGDIRISKIKVMRYLSTLLLNGFEINRDLLMYVVTKNSILNEEEYNAIDKDIYAFLRLSWERR